MERITIIGLGLIGSSLGLALKNAYGKGLEIIGHDIDSGAAKRAQQSQAVDKTAGNPRDAVKGAQMVILATPTMAMRDLLEFIGPHLTGGCIVTDTATIKQAVRGWADTYLPENVNFIGGNPLVTSGVSGPEGARADLLRNALYCLSPSSRAHQDAVQVMTDLVKAMGARPYFIDAYEHDSYAAATNQLPILLSNALVTVAAKSEGWRDISKHASTVFEDVSRLAAAAPMDNLDACITNKESLLHWLDQAIHELIDYRRLLERDTEGLGKTFAKAFQSREQWLHRRETGFIQDEQGPRPQYPSFGERMGALLVGDKLMERYRRLEEGRGLRDKDGPRKPRA